MKNVILSLLTVIAMSLLVLACETKTPDKKEHAASSEVYTCPMHPEVLSDKPGSCPKCGMDLVKKEENKTEVQPDSTWKADSAVTH